MMTQKKQNNTAAIVVMFFLFAMISFVTGLAAPVGVIWKNGFADSTNANTLGMLGNMMNFAAYALFGILSGKLLEKKGYKVAALTAAAVGFIGLLIQYFSGPADSFVVYLTGAFVAGISMCLLNTVVNPMLNTLGGGGNKGNQLIQGAGSFNSLTAALTPMLVGSMIGQVTKNTTFSDVNLILFSAMGVFALAFIILLIVRIPEPHLEKSKAAKAAKVVNTHSPLSFRHFIFGAIGIFIYVGVEVGIPNTMLYWLENTADKGGANLGATIAGFVAGTYWLMMFFGRFLGSAIGGKVSSKAMLSVASTLGIALVLAAMFAPTSTLVSMPVFTGSSFAMAQVPINALFFVLCGLCTSVMWGGIFNLAVEGLGKYTPAASGIFMTMVCGGGVLPLLQSFIADKSNYMSSYWLVIAGLAFLLFYAVAGSKNVNKNIPVE